MPNTTPIHPLSPRISGVHLTTTVDTAHDGANAVALFTAHASNPSRVDRVSIVSAGTVPATVVRFYVADVAVGATKYLYYEIATSGTDSESAINTRYITTLNLVLPPQAVLSVVLGTSAGAGTHAKIHVIAEGADY